jgi:hypothetical protein
MTKTAISPMTKTAISPLHWDLIVERIHKGFCVPFLGAGVNVSSEGYKGLPLGGEVALRLVEKLIGLENIDLKDLCEIITHRALVPYKDLTRIGLQNLARVALHVEFGTDPSYLITSLKTIIPDDECKPSPLLKTLARLPFQLIVTTNYDRLMEQALEDIQKPHKLIVQPIKGFDVAAQKDLQDELVQHTGLIVYKIHGTFPREEANAKKQDKDPFSRVIITEDDYIEFLTVVGIENMGVPNLIKEKMVDSTLLFLGYSLEDWDFRTIFKGLIESLPPRAQRKSFAIQKDPPDFWVEFWKRKNVEIYNVDLYEFAEALEQRYQTYIKASADGGKG